MGFGAAGRDFASAFRLQLRYIFVGPGRAAIAPAARDRERADPSDAGGLGAGHCDPAGGAGRRAILSAYRLYPASAGLEARRRPKDRMSVEKIMRPGETSG